MTCLATSGLHAVSIESSIFPKCRTVEELGRLRGQLKAGVAVTAGAHVLRGFCSSYIRTVSNSAPVFMGVPRKIFEKNAIIDTLRTQKGRSGLVQRSISACQPSEFCKGKFERCRFGRPLGMRGLSMQIRLVTSEAPTPSNLRVALRFLCRLGVQPLNYEQNHVVEGVIECTAHHNA
jgi:hypothetical protein